jgi:hypothetical protein
MVGTVIKALPAGDETTEARRETRISGVAEAARYLTSFVAMFRRLVELAVDVLPEMTPAR